MLGIVWLAGLGSVAAVILGHLSRSQAKRQGRPPSGLALAGLVLGYLGIAGTVLIAAAAVAFKDDIVSAVDVELELQSAADAQHSYHEVNNRYTTNLEELKQHGYVDISDKTGIRVVSATATTFCLTGTTLGEARYIDHNDSEATSTPCG